MADGKLSPPRDRIKRAIYENAVFDYEARKQNQAEDAANKSSAATMTEPPNSTMTQAGPEGGANVSRACPPIGWRTMANSPSMRTRAKAGFGSRLDQGMNLPPDQRPETPPDHETGGVRLSCKGPTPAERVRLIDGMTRSKKRLHSHS